MGGDVVKVVENNDHLGQIVSGLNQEIKNVDGSLTKGRKSLYGLLGPGFAYKCMLSPIVQMHLFRTFTCPRLRSGLSSFALRSNQMLPLAIFHRKILKAFLKLSKTAPTLAIHFLLGELPMEGKIHRDMCRTWVVNLRHISKMYNLRSSILSFEGPPFKIFVQGTCHH